MEQDYTYFNRDISWLSFNKRILLEAADDQVPLYDRIRFLAIYSSNLDEFFRVRVAAIRNIVRIDKKKINKKFKQDPKLVLKEILAEVETQQHEFGRIKRDDIIPELAKNNIIIYRDEPIRDQHKLFLSSFFKSRILTYLQPRLLSKASTVFLENRQLYFVIDLVQSESDIPDQAILNIPSDSLPRFISLPKVKDKFYYIAIDDVIRENLAFLFPYYDIEGCYSIKLNRDADLNIEDEFSGNLVKKIRKQIDKRHIGIPSRFLYDQSMPGHVLEKLKEILNLSDDDLVVGGRYHNMHDLFGLGNPMKPDLETASLIPLEHNALSNVSSIFDAIEECDQLLHFPYQSYDYILRFFNEASLDLEVQEIKVTFYRIAQDSFICNALISAANNGKRVTVFVEIKARFDEYNNLKWADRMEKAGITIIYSMPGLKVHAKVALVCKKKVNSQYVQYGYFGTGNFNEKTAKLYADQALLTTNETLTSELDSLFEYLQDNEKQPSFDQLLVSQFNIKDRFTELIQREIAFAKAGKTAYIIIKLNNLEDEYMIDLLYEASNAGVKIDLIIRAICCLVPGIKGQSENIEIHRIVDAYLEHSRAFYFYNNGNDELYQGSADWMKRNLYRRIEVVFPVFDSDLKQEVLKMLELQLNDSVKGVLIDSSLNNKTFEAVEPVRSQPGFHQWLSEKG